MERETDRLQIEDRRRPGFHWAYHEIIDEYGPQLGPYGLAVYYAMCRHANGSRECWPSYQTLADESGMSRRQAIREVARLLEMGLIKRVPRVDDQCGDQDTNLYIIVDPAGQRGGGARQSPPSDRQSPGVVNTSHQGSDRGSPKGEPVKKNHTKDNDDVEQNLKLLRDFGLVDPLLTEIAASRDTAWVQAAVEGVKSPGGVVHRHRENWQPFAKGRGSKEDRYRYFRGKYADYIKH